MQFNQMNGVNQGFPQELLNQQLQQQQALFGNKQSHLNLVAFQQQQQQQQLLRGNPLLTNMLNPALLAQFQMQQQIQLQQLQRILEAQKIFAKHPTNNRNNKPLPKQRKQQMRKQQHQQQQRDLPTSDEEKPLPHRRILAINLPPSLQTIESVTSVFHPYGDVTVVRVVKPGKNLPQDVKPWLRKIPDLGRTCCAVVDFETARAAKFAVHVLRQREGEVGFRCGLLKPGVEEKLYENRKEETKGIEESNLLKPEHSSDSGVTSEDQNSAASTRSTSASEHSDHSDSEIVSSHTDSDHESQSHCATKKYDREFLLSFAAGHKHFPRGLAHLDYILARERDEEQNCASEPIRQPRGPAGRSRGFKFARIFHK